MQNNEKQDSELSPHGRFLRHARSGQSFGEWIDEQCGVKRAPMHAQPGVDAYVMVSFDDGKVWHSAVFASLIDKNKHGGGPWSIPKATELARAIVAACLQKSPLNALKNTPMLIRVLNVDPCCSDSYRDTFRVTLGGGSS